MSRGRIHWRPRTTRLPRACKGQQQMTLRMVMAVLLGLVTGSIAAGYAVAAIGSATASGPLLPAVLALWLAGTVTTAVGAGGVAYSAVGLTELWLESRRQRQEGIGSRGS